jgi:hypothetical protein
MEKQTDKELLNKVFEFHDKNNQGYDNLGFTIKDLNFAIQEALQETLKNEIEFLDELLNFRNISLKDRNERNEDKVNWYKIKNRINKLKQSLKEFGDK